jgi:hypothetical protein
VSAKQQQQQQFCTHQLACTGIIVLHKRLATFVPLGMQVCIQAATVAAAAVLKLGLST